MLELVEFQLIPEFALRTKLGQNKMRERERERGVIINKRKNGQNKMCSKSSMILVTSTETKQQLILIFFYFAFQNILKEFSLTRPYGCIVSAN